MRDLMGQQGADAIGNTTEEFAAHIKAELAKWSLAVKTARVQPH